MKEKLLEEIRALLKSQRLAVLATSAEGHPYTSLVAFAETEDLRQVLFASHGKTRKVANIQNDPRVTPASGQSFQPAGRFSPGGSIDSSWNG